MRTLHHPALGKHDKAVRVGSDRKQIRLLSIDPTSHIPIGRMTYNLHVNVVALRNGLRALSGITRIDVQHLDAWIFGHRASDHRMSALAILHAGRRHTHGQQEPQGIHDQVALAALDLLACVVAGITTLRRAARGLGIEYRGRGFGGAPVSLTPLRAQAIRTIRHP